MADYIEREALVSKAVYMHGFGKNKYVPLRAIENAPTADVAPAVRGEWVGTEYEGYADGYPVWDTWECSNCRAEYASEGEPPAYKFCPDCGAKMEG